MKEAKWETEDRMRELYPRLFYEYKWFVIVM